MKLTHETFLKWQKWIEPIKNDLINMFKYHNIFKSFSDKVSSNFEYIKNNEGVPFCYFVRDGYIMYSTTAIRRLIKINKDSISLMGLLDELKVAAEQFTRDFYFKQFPNQRRPGDSLSQFSNKRPDYFDEFSDNGENLSKSKIEMDMNTLKDNKYMVKIERYADKIVAHHDKRKLSENELPEYHELDDLIPIIDKIACKYINFISSKGYQTLIPVLQFDPVSFLKFPVTDVN